MNQRLVAKLSLLLCSTGICLIVGEVGARFALPTRYYVWPPSTHRTIDTTTEYLHGVWGPSSFTINREGMRGEDYDRSYRYRILAVGGSTTICGMLDDAAAWPRVVQEIANRKLGPDAVFVGNVGRPGHSTPMHLLQVEKLLAQYDDFDAVLVLAGVNDMLVHLSILNGFLEIERDRTVDSQAMLRSAFSVVPVAPGGPWYSYSALATWIRMRIPTSPNEGWPVLDTGGSMIREQRKYRQRATRFVDALPDLSGVLRTYEKNLNRIIRLAEASGVRPILLTQPSVWRDGLSEEVVERLWVGGPPLNQPHDHGEYFSVSALAEAMARYNRRTLDVCAARGVECIDVAGLLPREGDFFFDDVHYTERGARGVAEIVASHLLETAPLSP